MSSLRSRWPWITIGLALVFAGRTLWLIDATALWSDELYSVGKSFQPSVSELMAMLRQDTHPPLYYLLLWCWGQWIGATPVTLRLLSWIAYLAGGAVMVAQAMALAPGRRVWPLALLMAFCSPYPVRFAIEGKSYALLVLLVALAWWWRRAERWPGYGGAVALACLTHFYGLFLFLAAACWDGWQRRWRAAATAALATLPAWLWMGYAADYLFSERSGSWIGPPDFALLEDTLARALGLWPLPKLALLLITVLLLRRWGGVRPVAWWDNGLLDRSGVIPSVLMVIGVVVVSFIKPLAFSRYFVVLLPAVLPWLAVQVAALQPNRFGRLLMAAVLAAFLLSWWGPGFAELDPAAGGMREQDQFRLISQRTDGLEERYAVRPRLLDLSDRMELAMGRINPPVRPWGDHRALAARLETPPLPSDLWLAGSGPPQVLEQRLRPLLQRAEQAGYRCEDRSRDLTHATVLQCRSGSMAPEP